MINIMFCTIHPPKIVWAACLAVITMVACNDQPAGLSPGQSAATRDSVKKTMEYLAADISANGPATWLKYFERHPGFFMASDGNLVFPNNDSASSFINNQLIYQIKQIKLEWSNMQIDPLTENLAQVAAGWHEDLTDVDNNTLSESGYFTALASKSPEGWLLRNLHWSSVRPLQPHNVD